MAVQVSLAPDFIFNVGPVMVSNSMIATFATTVLIFLAALYVRQGAGVIPTRVQTLFEVFVDFFMDQLERVTGSEKQARKVFPVFFTVFFFLLFANQFGLIPLLGIFVVGEEGVPLFRTPTTEYSLPIAMALTVLVFTHVLAFSLTPLGHLGNYIKVGPIIKALKARSLNDLAMGFVDFFLGLLDIIGELAKIISLSTRLFGNIVAGEVIIAIISSLFFFTQFVVPLPFLLLSTASSFVQAIVLPFLGMLFMGNILSALPSKKT